MLEPNKQGLYALPDNYLGQFNEDGKKFKALFEQLEPAILNRHKITLYYKGSYHLLEPYKLINHHCCWYLVALKDESLPLGGYYCFNAQNLQNYIHLKKIKLVCYSSHRTPD
ncbi:TPA: hypothetical protein ACHKB2_001078 [Acinetobacter baumannii]